MSSAAIPGEGEGDIIQSIWRSRIVLLSAFGLIGVGAVFGAGSVYVFYVRNKLQDIFKLHSELYFQLNSLKKEVDRVNQNLSQSQSQTDLKDELVGTNSSLILSRVPSSAGGDRISSPKSCESIVKVDNKASNLVSSKKNVRVRDGDDDEYVTASSDSDVEVQFKNSNKGPLYTDNLDIPTIEGTDSWIADFLRDVDKLLDGDASSQHEAYVRLQSYKDKLDKFCGFCWRFAKATHMEAEAAHAAGDKEMKRSLTYDAVNRAEQALKLNDKSANAHKWYAITLGSKGDYVSINDKIKNGFIFKQHVDKALQLNPNDPSLHYLLGRFCLEVSQLGWVERKVASTLFSSPPNSTPQEALNHFKEAEKFGKPLKDNRYYMAKCYVVLKNYERAAYYLKMALEMPNLSHSDKQVHEEADKLFSKYRQYLKL